MMPSLAEEKSPEWKPDPNQRSQFGTQERDVRSSEPEKRLKTTNFWILGGSIGSPAGANLLGGYYFRDFVLRGSGMRWGSEWWGGQVDLGYTFWKTSVLAHSVSLVAGSFVVDPMNPAPGRGGQRSYPTGVDFPGYTDNPPSLSDLVIRSQIQAANPSLDIALQYLARPEQKQYLTQSYLGVTYDLLLGSVFLQFGVGVGRGDFRNPVLLLQAGTTWNSRSKEE